jgi:outer membrane biosynthesis protein TonB
MRPWTLAVFAIAISGAISGAIWAPAAAQSEDEPDKNGWRPQFIAGAKPEELKAVFPKAAWDQKITGEVTLGCVADAKGALQDCHVLKEKPAGQGFGAAALQVVGKERIRPKTPSGDSVAGYPVRTQIDFLAPGDSNPTWLKKPTSADLAGVFPTAAIKAGKDGKAGIGCQVTVEGFLQNCKVLFEDPVGLGFGQAALQLAPQFRMTPKIRGGQPMPGGSVSVPIVWAGLAGGGFRPTGQSLVLDPPWIAAPTAAEVAAAWPAEAGDLPSGQAALRCDLDKTGGLRSCDIISENPRGRGFGKAAKTLSKAFKVSFGGNNGKDLDDFKIDVPFRFRNPATPDTRKLTKPNWIRTLTPEGMAGLYPEAAIKAGVKSGLGVVSCQVGATGELTECQATREDPPGLEFAAAAIQAAGVMRMNPWTKEGDPVEGLKISLPIRFAWEGPPPKPAEDAGPTKP